MEHFGTYVALIAPVPHSSSQWFIVFVLEVIPSGKTGATIGIPIAMSCAVLGIVEPSLVAFIAYLV